jgi:hypothetical protein
MSTAGRSRIFQSLPSRLGDVRMSQFWMASICRAWHVLMTELRDGFARRHRFKEKSGKGVMRGELQTEN